MSLEQIITFTKSKISKETDDNKKGSRYYILSVLLASKALQKNVSKQQQMFLIKESKEAANISNRLLSRGSPSAAPVPVPFCLPCELQGLLGKKTDDADADAEKEKEKDKSGIPNRQSWDRLTKTSASAERQNPFFYPFPHEVVDQGGNIREVPTEENTIIFKDIAGLQKVKDKLTSSIIDPFIFPSIIDKRSKQKAFVFSGVPGTGKTAIVRATTLEIKDPYTGERLYRPAADVEELDKNILIGDRVDEEGNEVIGFRKTFYPSGKVPKVILFNIENQDIQSALIGEAERKISRFFEMAQQVAPCMLFFDEAEAYLNADNKNNAGNISTFKTEVVGFDTMDRDIIIIIASNFPSRLSDGIMSRFETIEIGLPGRLARYELIKTTVKKNYKIPTDEDVFSRSASLISLFTTPPSSKKSISSASNDAFNQGVLEYRNFYKTLSKQEEDIINKMKDKALIYSGRDLDNLFKMINIDLGAKVPKGKVVRCEGQGALDLCKKYRNFLQFDKFKSMALWIPVANDNPNGVSVSDVPPDERQQIVSNLMDLETVINIFDEFKPTVSLADVFEQISFNDSRGDKCSGGIDQWWQLYLKEQKIGSTQGCNGTVPEN